MSDKASLMYYCQDRADAAHMCRVIALARELADRFSVTLVVGREIDATESIPDGVDVLQLPEIDIDPADSIVETTGNPKLRSRIIERRNLLRRHFSVVRPRVVIVDRFPFGDHFLQGEILPMVERARYGMFGETLVVSMTNGIVMSDRPDMERYDDRTAQLLNKFFDLVLVDSDPVFARLEEFFQPRNRVETPVYHVGFLVPGQSIIGIGQAERERRILVSAGDGSHGGSLCRAAVEEQSTLWGSTQLPMTVVCGDRLPDADWRLLECAIDGVPAVTLQRTMPNIKAAISTSACSVSQCDYDTAIHTICSCTPGLFIPSNGHDRLEQTIRAQRLVYWGAGRILMPHHMNGASLANEIHQLTRFTPRQINFDLNGIQTTANLVAQIVYENNFAPLTANRSSESRLH